MSQHRKLHEKLLTLLFACFAFARLDAAEGNWITDFAKAQQQAKAEK